jgi:hypothetical protein
MNLKQRLQMEQKEFQTLENKYSFKRMKKDETEEVIAPEIQEETAPKETE